MLKNQTKPKKKKLSLHYMLFLVEGLDKYIHAGNNNSDLNMF